MKGVTIALVAAAALAAPNGARAASSAADRRPARRRSGRSVAPSELQVYNDFAVPARAYASRRAVVHYVVLGVDAPPLNDDDRNDVPDYVERVGAAADTAIAYYEQRGFAEILADAGGPDARPDIYVSRFAPGYFGVAFPAADADGGAFMVVSNALDPSAESSLGSLYGTVAHELFHLVQFSYFSRPTSRRFRAGCSRDRPPRSKLASTRSSTTSSAGSAPPLVRAAAPEPDCAELRRSAALAVPR